jgi:hypothetical protein
MEKSIHCEWSDHGRVRDLAGFLHNMILNSFGLYSRPPTIVAYFFFPSPVCVVGLYEECKEVTC